MNQGQEGRRVQSAGGVVRGPADTIAVVSQDDGTWSLPKGHAEAGESLEQTARREVAEETGLENVDLVGRIGSYERSATSDSGDPEVKEITLFYFVCHSSELQPRDERNPEAIWLPVNEVASKLSNHHDADFFRSVVEPFLSQARA